MNLLNFRGVLKTYIELIIKAKTIPIKKVTLNANK